MAQGRSIVMKTPQAGGQLQFQSLTGTETLGRIFEYEIHALAPVNNIEFAKLLGQHVTVMLELPGGESRFLDGRIAKIGLVGVVGNQWRYRITARPWTWMLTRTTDCKIFQDKNVTDIIEEVFADQPNADYDLRTTATYKPRTYCVQYRETDLDFVSRLMEEEGIYTFWEHEDGKHTLVVCDAPGAHKSSGTLPFYPMDKAARALAEGHEFVHEWSVSAEVQTGATALRDYDFEKPTVDLLVRRDKDLNYPEANHEVFDYPGEYREAGDGETIARTRLEELQAPYEVVQGIGNARSITCGKTFTLREFGRADQNKEWLVVETTITASTTSYESGGGQGGDYSCVFRLQPSKTPYRSPRTTPRPIVRGPQTAVVTGPAGEEIHLDKYGRIKVQFHWDRYGKYDDKSSCWIRVSQAWAGKQWGFVTNPRIGQEVIVSFLEGNPDDPIVTGRVYNAENMPPYAVPASGTQSGIKSRSSKGGTPSNFNEIRFEDKKGEEHFAMHAEKDMMTSVENDASRTIGRDDSLSINRDQFTKIGRHQKIEILKTLTETVTEKVTNVYNNGMSVTVKGAGAEEYFEPHHKMTVNGPRHEHVIGVASVFATAGIKDETTGPVTIAGTQVTMGGTSGAVNITSATDVKIGAVGGKMTLTASSPFEVGAASMLFSAQGNVEYFATNFNRTISEGNDIIMGPNSNCYMGMASDTSVAIARSAFMGLSMDTKMALSAENFLGLKMDGAAAISIESAAGIKIEQGGMSMYQSGIKMLQGGGGGPAAGPATLGPIMSAVVAGGSVASVVAGAALSAYDMQAMLDSYREAAKRADEVGRHDIADRLNGQIRYLEPLVRLSQGLSMAVVLPAAGPAAVALGAGIGQAVDSGSSNAGATRDQDAIHGATAPATPVGHAPEVGPGAAGKGGAIPGAGGKGGAIPGPGGKGGALPAPGGKGGGVPGGAGSPVPSVPTTGKGVGSAVDDLAGGKGKGAAIGGAADDIASGKATGKGLGAAADEASGGQTGGMGKAAGGAADDLAGGKGGGPAKGGGAPAGGKGDPGKGGGAKGGGGKG